MGRKSPRTIMAVLAIGLVTSLARGQGPTSPDARGQAVAEQRAASQLIEKFTESFNRGDARQVASLFLAEAEIVDDAGNRHKGRPAIEAIYARFFERFPQAKAQIRVESLRLIGSALAIEEGTQITTTRDGVEKSTTRFTAVLANQGHGWAFASAQQFSDDDQQSPHDRLKALEWMVGSWIDEDAEAVVKINCRWSEDGNFLLVNFDAQIQGKLALKSVQRIGWDPLSKKIRSWVFDSDGGYGEGYWTQVENSWIIKSTAVTPDGQSGSATIVVEPQGKDKFIMKGADRILGDDARPDYTVTIVRRPPEPAR